MSSQPNPEFVITKKEYALIKWAARHEGLKNAGEFSKMAALTKAREIIIKYKKEKEQLELKKVEAEEVEREQLMEELVKSGDLDADDKYIRKHVKKKVDDSEMPPHMEGQMPREENE